MDVGRPVHRVCWRATGRRGEDRARARLPQHHAWLARKKQQAATLRAASGDDRSQWTAEEWQAWFAQRQGRIRDEGCEMRLAPDSPLWFLATFFPIVVALLLVAYWRLS